MFQEGNQQTQDVDKIECLRHILERQQSRVVTSEEATEIGESLIAFYELLGENPVPVDEQFSAESAG